MIELREIDAYSDDYDFVQQLLHTAFPPEERRDDDDQRSNTLLQPRFHCLLVSADGVSVGLFTYWDFEDFRYVEHFAIHTRYRNSGLGSMVLQQVLNLSNKPMVLEVEPASLSLQAVRRILFYQRAGLQLWTTPYCQPPYRSGDRCVPLHLMAQPPLCEKRDFRRIESTLHRYVYEVKK